MVNYLFNILSIKKVFVALNHSRSGTPFASQRQWVSFCSHPDDVCSECSWVWMCLCVCTCMWVILYHVQACSFTWELKVETQ